MDEILEKMEAAAEEEYEKILAKWRVFHSAHEGYGVLLEEVEEAQEEMERNGEDEEEKNEDVYVVQLR